MNPRTKNYVIAFLALTTVAGGAMAWNFSQRLALARADADLAAAQRADWQKRIWDAEKRRTELETQLASTTKDPTESTERRGPGGPGGMRGGPMGNMAALLENPEFAKAWNTQQKAALDARFAGLFKKLNLSPEALDKLKSLLVEKQNSRMDVMTAAREQGLDPRTNRAELQALEQQAQADVDASIQSTLGATAYAEYQAYEQTLSQRSVVSQLETRLSYSSTALTSAQSEALVSILASTQSTDGSTAVNVTAMGGAADIATAMMGGRSSTVITDAAITQAASVLSADQVTALKSIQAEQQAQAQMGQLLRQQRTSSGGTTRGGG